MSQSNLKKYESMIRLLCHRYSSAAYQEEDFEDLFQECCLICMKIEKKHNPDKGKFSTFLYTSIRNYLITRIAKVDKTKEGRVNLNEKILDREQKESVWEMLPELNELETSIIDMKLSGMSNREIMEHYGFTNTTYYRLYNEIITKIRHANENSFS